MERWNGGIVETHDNTNGAVIKLSAADSSSILGHPPQCNLLAFTFKC